MSPSVVSRKTSPRFRYLLIAATAVCLLSLGVSARAWFDYASARTASSTKPQAAAQQVTRGGGEATVVQRHLLPPRAREDLNALGDRLEKSGKERLVLAGVLSHGSGSEQGIPVRIVMEHPQYLRIQSTGAAIGFDGKDIWESHQVLGGQDRALVESLLFDSAERFFISRSKGRAVRSLGSGFRLNDDAASPSDPVYDAYELIDDIPSGDTIRTQPKLFFFDAKTRLLGHVRYDLMGDNAPVKVEVAFDNWQSFQGQRLPGSITRLENGAVVFHLTITDAAVSPRGGDGIFARP